MNDATNGTEGTNTAAKPTRRQRLRAWLHRKLFGAECRWAAEDRAQLWLLRKDNAELCAALRKLERKPARLEVAGGMTAQQIEDRLAGAHSSEPVRAILAKIGAKIIELSDRATDAPREQMETRDGVIPAFGHDDRIYVAGGAAALAELQSDLQELVKDRPEVAAKAS